MMWDALLVKARQGKIPEKAAALWGADPDSVKLVNADHNLLFRMRCGGKIRYLRITHPLIRSHAELMAAIAFRRYLFESGAPICQPVQSRSGHDVEEVKYWDESFLVYASDAVQGDAIYLDHPQQQVILAWGKALAHLHRAAKSYHPLDQHQYLYWHDSWQETGRFAAEEDDFIRREYDCIDEWFWKLSKNQHHFGLIHGNHRSGKVFFDGQKVRLIDFDEPQYHWYWADVASTFLDLSQDKFGHWKEKAQWFLEGYHTILPFEEEERHYLPWFMRMKKIWIFISG